MRIAGGMAVLLLTLMGSPALASPQEDERDQLIRELKKQIDALEQRVGELEDSEPSDSVRLERKIDESLRQSPVETVREPMRLNLSAPQADRITFGGRFRTRGQWWGNYDAGSFPGSNDDALTVGQSLEVNMDVRLTEKANVFFELHDGRNWGTSGPSFQGTTPVGNQPGVNPPAPGGFGTEENDYVSQAWLGYKDLFGQGVDLKAGRMQFDLGHERQFGDDLWRNNRTSLDGLHFVRDFGEEYGTLHAAAFRITDGDSTSINEFSQGAGGRNAELYVLYYETEFEVIGDFDAYFHWLDADSGSPSTGTPTFGPATGESRLGTYGVRVGDFEDPQLELITFEVEAATQFGKYNGIRSDDYGFNNVALFSRVGMWTDDVPYFKKAYVGYDYATGDSGNDNENDAYVQMYPVLHGWFGLTDFVSWTNVEQWLIGSEFQFLGEDYDDSFRLEYRWLELQNKRGGFLSYNTPATAAAPANPHHDLGQEFDITYGLRCAENMYFDVGYAYFWPGSGYRSYVGDSDDVQFAYLQMAVSF